MPIELLNARKINSQINDINNKINTYGVEWNETLDIWTRLGSGESVADFNNIYPWSKMRRCNLSDAGVVLSYYGDPTYIEDGTNGQVMVEIPKFFFKYDGGTNGLNQSYHRWYISPISQDGFETHAMFNKDISVVDNVYISAYEGSIYDVSASSYLLTDQQVADFTVVTGDKLSSIANAKPCSGLTQDLTIAKSRILSNNRGSGWGLLNATIVAGIQHLFMIEYASANSQSKIGLGIVSKTDDGSTNMANNTGATSFLGNNTGRQIGTDGLTSVSYRGIENFWGNIWKFVDGINIQADNKLWINATNINMVSDSYVAPYVLQGALSNTNGYVSTILKNKNGLFATSSTGSSSTKIPDYYYQNTGNRVALLGAAWDIGSKAGFACWSLSNAASNRSRSIGARIVKI